MDITERKITKIAREAEKLVLLTLREKGVGTAEIDLIHALRHHPGCTQAALVYSDDKQLTAPVHHYLHQNLHLTGGRVGQIGPTIGTHIGPGAVGVAFVIPE